MPKNGSCEFWGYQMWISQNSQILSILLVFLAFLSNFWQNHIWQLAKTGHSDPLAKTCLIDTLLKPFSFSIYYLVPSDFKTNTTSECHAKCGTGYKIVTTTNCEFDKLTGMSCNIFEKRETCNVTKKCSPEIGYGQWSQWTNCKTSCRRGMADKRYQTRTRKCLEESCKNGKII